MSSVESLAPSHLGEDPEIPEAPSSSFSLLDRREGSVVFALAVVAGAVVALAGMTPTATAGWDPLLGFAMGAGFVLAGSRADTRAVLVAAGLAATFVGLTFWLFLGLAALGIALLIYKTGRTAERAAAGCLTVIVLSHLSDFGVFGLSALVAGAAVLIVGTSAYRSLAAPVQNRIRSAIVWAGLGIGALLVVALYQVIGIRSTSNSGVQAARWGLTAARAGDTAELTVQLDRAQTQLEAARDSASAPWLRPLELVPVASQHLQSLRAATEQGVVVINEGAGVLQDVDLDQLELRQGQFDLDLLASLAPQLLNASSRLETAVDVIEAQLSPWLLPPVADQLEALIDEANEIMPETQLAAAAAEVVPGLLGADGERRYLMLFGAPAEAREFGGFVGGYALISVIDGGLDLVESGSINELLDIARASELVDPDTYPDRFLQSDPVFFPQNLTSSPNLDLVARAAREIIPEIAGAPIDGVMYLDPYALAAMTEFTGPIVVPGLDEPLDAAGLINFMFEEQYRVFETRDERFGAIGALATATASGFENADLPGPERLGEVLGPVARAGRLQIATYDDAENDFLASVLLQRDFAPLEGADSLAVIHSNATASKLDLYLRRQVTYDLTVRADGSLSGTIDIVLTSDVPEDAPLLTFGETDGTNEVLLSLYTVHELVTVTVDGRPHEAVPFPEFGFQRYALLKFPVEANTSVTVRFVIKGEAPTDPYRVQLWAQPLVHPDLATVTFRTPGASTTTENRQVVENWLYETEAAGG